MWLHGRGGAEHRATDTRDQFVELLQAGHRAVGDADVPVGGAVTCGGAHARMDNIAVTEIDSLYATTHGSPDPRVKALALQMT
ncbi:hypothetical protein SCMC78_20450 [Streptomyces sp. CMC78]|uniref:Uncharacterized protein n=1 Tax=Streptomyces sp. CMC78 TaxID=3231512 RepID=A0AB33KF46_9ACTN|nr:hypothetical protein [Streptomyces sp. ID01-9D]